MTNEAGIDAVEKVDRDRLSSDLLGGGPDKGSTGPFWDEGAAAIVELSSGCGGAPTRSETTGSATGVATAALARASV